MVAQNGAKNSLVDGEYTVAGCTWTCANNILTETVHAAYKTINIPFKNPIELSTGDVVTFSSVNFNEYNYESNISVGFNSTYFSTGGNYKPIRTPVSEKTVTMTEDITATSLRIQASTATVNLPFRFVLKVNGEEVIS